jgi:tetratricopeptide (TPR) repeat protein
MLSLIPMRQGKFAEALRVVDDGISADRMEQYRGFWFIIKESARAEALHAQRDYAAALSALREWQKASRSMFPEDFINDRPWEVRLLLASGDTLAARNVTDQLRKDILATDTTQMRSYRIAEARMAFSAGRYLESARILELSPQAQASDRRFVERCLLGEAYLRGGEADKALTILEKAALTYDESQSIVPYDNVRIHYLLGMAHEETGQKDRAAQEYKRFLEIWKDADPGIPEMDDAKSRLARLAS